MGLESYITDPSNHKKAHIDCPPHEKNGLIVSTRPLKEFRNLTAFFLNPTFGIDLNINASTEQDPSISEAFFLEEIYDGEDNAQWLGSIITGSKWDLTSINQANSGVASVESVNSLAGDTIQFSRPTGDLVLTPYQALTMWIYVTSGWSAGDEITIIGWESDTASQVGGKVSLENYFSEATTGIWQKLSIPLPDMALAGQMVDSFRISIEARDTSGPTFYIDDMQLEGVRVGGGPAVGPQIFTVKPPENEWYHIQEITSTLASSTVIAPNVLADATMPYMDYTTFLGVEMEVGITFQSISNGEVVFSFSTTSIGSTLSVPNTSVNLWGTGDTTFMQNKVKLYSPVLLKGESDDEFRIILNDDLSGFLTYRTSVGGLIENRVNNPFPKSNDVVNRALR